MPNRSALSITAAATIQRPGDEPSPTARWGWALPVACAAHCAVTPALVAVAPALAMSEGVEWLLLAGSGGLAAWMAWSSGRGRERHSVIALLVSGLLLWGASLGGWTTPVPEPVTSSAGALLLALGMFLTARRDVSDRSRCACSACHDNPAAAENPGVGAVRDFPLGGR